MSDLDWVPLGDLTDSDMHFTLVFVVHSPVDATTNQPGKARIVRGLSGNWAAMVPTHRMIVLETPIVDILLALSVGDRILNCHFTGVR